MTLEELELYLTYVKSELPPGYGLSIEGWDKHWSIKFGTSQWSVAKLFPCSNGSIGITAGYSGSLKYTLDIHDPEFGDKLKEAMIAGNNDKYEGWDDCH